MLVICGFESSMGKTMVELKSSICNAKQPSSKPNICRPHHGQNNAFKPPLITKFEPDPHLMLPDEYIQKWLTPCMSS